MDAQTTNLLFLGVLAIMLYFTLIRPQRRRAAEQRAMLEALKVGDEIVTVGGIFARVVATGERVTVAVSGAELELVPQAISRVVTEDGDVPASDDEHGR